MQYAIKSGFIAGFKAFLTGCIRLRRKPQAPTPQTPKFATAK